MITINMSNLYKNINTPDWLFGFTRILQQGVDELLYREPAFESYFKV